MPGWPQGRRRAGLTFPGELSSSRDSLSLRLPPVPFAAPDAPRSQAGLFSGFHRAASTGDGEIDQTAFRPANCDNFAESPKSVKPIKANAMAFFPDCGSYATAKESALNQKLGEQCSSDVWAG